MASTYSNLKIQLMTTGENSTTWGNVTNVNLGTAIEEAITGSADVTFSSADVTLTLTDTNTSQTARNMRLNLTGTSGGARNLIVPAIEKAYIINNGLADAVTVKNSTGTGISVAAGKTSWVFNNGTNVVDAVTTLSSLTLGTALPVASGGTGGNTSALARTNLGLGTIATQDAATVNITGGSITGITDLAVADGGTGASTAATARTNLGATTVGGNLFTLTNPSAVTFPQFNADNTVSALSAASFRTAIGAGAGTVTSVGGTGTVNGLTLSGTVTGTGNITLSGDVTSVNASATVNGFTIGYRQIPRSTTTTTAVVGDVGKCIAVSAGITIPNSTFAAGDAISIYNDSAASITITAGVTTLRQAGTTNTGNRTLAARGMATIWFNSATEAIISGAGVS